MMLKGRARLADVARRAGVSESTVSRTLRNPKIVSEETRARILAAIEETGYVPSLAARALASGRTDVIGVLVPSVTNHVFAAVLEGLYEAADGHNFDIQLGNTRYDNAIEDDLLRVFLSQSPAGLIVAGIDQSPAARALLAGATCPVVQIMEVGSDPVDMLVGFSHSDAAAAATRHMIERGYSRIAFIGAQMDPRTRRRQEGLQRTLTEAGLHDPDLAETTSTPSSVTVGAQLFSRLIERRPDADGVFCNNDDLALGVLFEAQRRGISIPDRLGLCGFNDFESMQTAEPSVTSVRTNRREMGRRAIRMLFDRIAGREVDEPVVDLGYQIVPRRSTAGRRA